jgi:very-short-patch-repair endonuclease
VDRRIAEHSARQQNLISVADLRALGVTRDEWRWRVRTGHLHPVHRGVFAVGSPSLMALGRERAALLAVGDRAVLSHGSAAALWGLLPFHATGPVELSSDRNRRSRPGILVHRTNHLDGDVRTHRGLALTSPARVVLDMAGRLDASALERLAAEAIVADAGAEEEIGRRGSRRLRELVGGGPRRTRSQNERALMRLVRDAGLPLPRTNVVLHGEEVDAYWPPQRLVVEVDDFFTHGDRMAFTRDRRKQAALMARGIAVMRVTGGDLAERPARVVATLAQALARAA